MDIQAVNYFLKLVKEALEWLQKLNESAREGGFPPFDLLPQKTAMELTTAHNDDLDDETIRLAYRRMKNRDRQRRYRQRHQQARKNYKTVAGDAKYVTDNKKSVTCNAKNVMRNAVTQDALAPAAENVATLQPGPDAASACTETEQGSLFCDADVTETRNASVTFCNASAKKEKENAKRKKQRKEKNKNKKIKTLIADAMPNSARAREENAAEMNSNQADATGKEADRVKNTLANPDGGCLPFVPPEKKTTRLILTKDLSEMHQKVVLAWNKLPLPKKLNGLFPSMVWQLNQLFESYGEEAVHEAIARVADSPFLLGKSKNNRGWVADLYWLLQPENLEKTLSGRYQDDAPRSRQGNVTPTVPDGFYGTVVY